MKSLLERLNYLENMVLVLLLALMIISGLSQLVLRNLFDTGFLWNDAFNKVLLLWGALFGALAATRNNRHIKISLLDKLIPQSYRYLYFHFLSIISGSLCLFVAWYSFLFVLEEYEYGEKAFAEIPIWITESVIPITFLLIASRYFVSIAVKPSENDDD